MSYLWSAATHIGRLRDGNEDAVHPEGSGRNGTLVAAVADGMGGHVGGEVASRIAIEAATAADDGVAGRIAAANAAVVDHAAGHPRLRGMGTTLTLGVFSTRPSVEIGHVGDSRAYLLRDGGLRRITEDHSVVAELLAGGMITEDEARFHPQRNLVTRSLGLAPSIEADVETFDLEPGDRVLLCSDGLTNMVDDDNIAGLLGEGTPDEAVWALIEAANRAGGHDNVTVVVVDVVP